MGCCGSKDEDEDSVNEQTTLLGNGPASPGKQISVILDEPVPTRSINSAAVDMTAQRRVTVTGIQVTSQVEEQEAARKRLEQDLIDVTDRAARALVVAALDDDVAFMSAEEAELRARSYAAAVSRLTEVAPPQLPHPSAESNNVNTVLRAPIGTSGAPFGALLASLTEARSGIRVTPTDPVVYDLNALTALEAES
eukprot:m.55037 g.55037  ORF g.55037 m.55037 type:complete len:195 (+) comp7577_c1_seq2:303-887(+)